MESLRCLFETCIICGVSYSLPSPTLKTDQIYFVCNKCQPDGNRHKKCNKEREFARQL